MKRMNMIMIMNFFLMVREIEFYVMYREMFGWFFGGFIGVMFFFKNVWYFID